MSYKYPCECCGHPCQVYGSRYCGRCGPEFPSREYSYLESATVPDELDKLEHRLKQALNESSYINYMLGSGGRLRGADLGVFSKTAMELWESLDAIRKRAYRIRRILNESEGK